MIKPFIFILLFFALMVSTIRANDDNKDDDVDWESEIDIILGSDSDNEDWDMIFNLEPEELSEDPSSSTGTESGTVSSELARTRLTMRATYNMLGALSPGWTEHPWYDLEPVYNEDGLIIREKDFSYYTSAIMEALISLDFQISQNLRIWNSFYFFIPPSSGNINNLFQLKEFYFDYNINNVLFVRAGQYELAWGISRVFPFTNLPVRIPINVGVASDSNPAYVLRLEAPIGIGGLQFLTMTRLRWMESPSEPRLNDFGFGLKYNLAIQRFDLDTGVYYHELMPLRFFVSLKTTIVDTEVYTEGLMSVDHESSLVQFWRTNNTFYWDKASFSWNIGFAHNFFRNKLSIGGELFYNGEKGAMWYREKDDIRDAESNPLFEGWNSALNVIYRPGLMGIRVFTQFLYAWDITSIHLVPGFKISPSDQLALTLSMPMALGTRDSNSYYRHNDDIRNRPFAIVLGVSISGNFRYRIYMDRSAN